MPEKNFYITTPIYYPSGKPHMGHAYSSIIADVFARFKKIDGYKAYFLTGTDEHGLKIQREAKKNNKDPKKFCDELSITFKNLTKTLNLSNNDFIRTTEKRHYDSVKEIWERLEKSGDIYLGKYSGWYSVSDEAYYDEEEIIDENGSKKSKTSGSKVEWVEEESYFFKLSAWNNKLLKFYQENPKFILPVSRRNEVVNFVKKGLKDLSVSRTSFSWGIPVPSNKKHIIYVWLDALTNYISALKFPDTENKLYSILKEVDRWQREHEWRGSHSNFPDMEDPDVIDRVSVNEKQTRNLKITHPVQDGQTLGNFEFYYTPGHSPDELCIKLDNVLFSGDHILPRITPHPSMSLSYEPFKNILPKSYQGGNEYYGLLAYIKSLKKASSIESIDLVLAAHRAYRYGQFNLIDLSRIPEIIDHHKERCVEILHLIETGVRDLTELTHKTFSNRVLEGNQFYSAFTENISHLEILRDAGDIVFEGGQFLDVSPTGSNHFIGLIDNC